MTRGGEHRNPRPTRPTNDHRGGHAELPKQPGQRVGLHRRLRRAGEADVGLAAVRAVPDQDLISLAREGFRELPDTAVVLAEPATGRDHPRPTFTDDLV